MQEPRELALATEGADVPAGGHEERFGGYGVMGLPFRSGHVLTLRRFSASSLGVAVSGMLPARAWASPALLRAMGRVAGSAMRVGRVNLQGMSPNGQAFQAHPLRVWKVADSSATVDGEALGPPGPVADQARLGEFFLPQRGVLAIGRSFFDAFDPDRHVAVCAGS